MPQSHLFKLIAEVRRAIKSDNYPTILQIVKDSVFDINRPGESNFTPLICAIEENKPNWVQLFLLMGANPYQRCALGEPASYARRLQDEEPQNPIPKILSKFMKNSIIVVSSESKREFISAIKEGNVNKLKGKLAKDNFAYTDLEISEDSLTGLGLAVDARSFDVAALIIEQGAIVSAESLQKLIKKNAKQLWCQSIIELIKLEKQKQIDMVEAFCKVNGNINACLVSIQKIKEKHNKQIEVLRVQHTKDLELQKLLSKANCSELYDKISDLKIYGDELVSQGMTKKGNRVVILAGLLSGEVCQFARTGDKDTASKNISRLLKDGYREMGNDRKFRDILGHILLALTGVGLVIMGIHKFYTGTFFLNSTKRQEMLGEIKKEAHRVIPSM